MPKIKKIYDNIVKISGKYKYKQDMIFNLSKDAKGYLISASQEEASLLVIGDPSSIQKTNGNVTLSKDKISDVNIYDNYFGSIISPFGNILHGAKDNHKGKLLGKASFDANSPALLDRVKLSKPLETGMVAIDTMIPIGRGQRELIIGDRATGKTTIAINTIINQKQKNVKTIYVAIGQKRNSVIKTYKVLQNENAHKNNIIIFASPDSAAEQFFAPKIGMAIAEFFAYQGEDVLIVLDDLTKHANVYREISLSIDKSPGREAYPTDIFYQHSKLLERAGRFNKKYKEGSITCLPIVETVQGDVASIIPSNVISITDGQIFTSMELANNGVFPAINIGLSVSRTGSSVQSTELKEISKGLKGFYLELFDIKKFADMSVDISPLLQEKILDWQGVNNLLVQHGSKGYSKAIIMILVELFKMKDLNKIKHIRDFNEAFRNFCIKNKEAKKYIESITSKNKTFVLNQQNKLKIKAIFSPLTKIASGIKNDIISEKEYNQLKEVK